MSDDTIGNGPPTSQQRRASTIIVAMLTAIVRNDGQASADVARLKEDLREVEPDPNAVIDLMLQTASSIINTMTDDPVGQMQFFLDHIRNGPTSD